MDEEQTLGLERMARKVVEAKRSSAASDCYGLCHRCKAPIHVERYSLLHGNHIKSWKAYCSAGCGQLSSQLKESPEKAVEDFYSYP